MTGWRRARPWLLATLTVAVLGLAVALVFRIDPPAAGGWMPDLTVAHIEDLIAGWGEWAWVGSILLMVLHSFLPLPAEVIAIANGMLFGPILGIALTWLGGMFGAALSFALARHLGRPAVHRFVPERHWQRVEGWEPRIATLLAVRLIPLISFNLINYGAGLAKVGWWPFLWTTAIGILPITIASVVLGDLTMQMRWWHVGGLIAGVGFFWWIALRLTRGGATVGLDPPATMAASGPSSARSNRPPADPP